MNHHQVWGPKSVSIQLIFLAIEATLSFVVWLMYAAPFVRVKFFTGFSGNVRFEFHLAHKPFCDLSWLSSGAAGKCQDVTFK
jgi:hypothetical protein